MNHPKIDHWGYRTIVTPSMEGFNEGDEFSLIEAYFDKDGKVVGWHAAHPPMGETLAELVADIDGMSRAARNYEPIDVTTLPGWEGPFPTITVAEL